MRWNMKKNVVIIVLVLIVIALIGYIVWDKTANNISTSSDDFGSGEYVIKNSGDRQEGNVLSGENGEESRDERIITIDEETAKKLVNADKFDTSNLKKMNFTNLKIGSESRKTLNINGKDVTFELTVNGYSAGVGESLGASIDFYYTVLMLDSTDGTDKYDSVLGSHSGTAIVYDSDHYGDDAATINIEKAKKELCIEIGKLKDSATSEEYIVIYVVEEDFSTDSLYIYSIGEGLLVESHHNSLMYFANLIPKDDDWILVSPFEFFDNQILYYDMYTSTKIGENTKAYCEKFEKIYDMSYDMSLVSNSLHKLTIENGKVVDKIVKIYENVPLAQT